MCSFEFDRKRERRPDVFGAKTSHRLLANSVRAIQAQSQAILLIASASAHTQTHTPARFQLRNSLFYYLRQSEQDRNFLCALRVQRAFGAKNISTFGAKRAVRELVRQFNQFGRRIQIDLLPQMRSRRH